VFQGHSLPKSFIKKRKWETNMGYRPKHILSKKKERDQNTWKDVKKKKHQINLKKRKTIDYSKNLLQK